MRGRVWSESRLWAPIATTGQSSNCRRIRYDPLLGSTSQSVLRRAKCSPVLDSSESISVKVVSEWQKIKIVLFYSRVWLVFTLTPLFATVGLFGSVPTSLRLYSCLFHLCFGSHSKGLCNGSELRGKSIRFTDTNFQLSIQELNSISWMHWTVRSVRSKLAMIYVTNIHW